MRKLKRKTVKERKQSSWFYKGLRSLVLFLIIWGGIAVYVWGAPKLANIVAALSNWGVNRVLSSVGTPPQKDQFGNINFLIVGYGGRQHQWGMLADSIMLASYNPEQESVTFVSIPRDLYVKYPWGWGGRINALFAGAYYKWGRDVNYAAQVLMDKVAKITGIKPDYYALISFKWFVDFVDYIGGLDIYLKEPFVDPKYPTEDGGYTTFYLPAWEVHLDGETALKFARSRHSTSDFSRALRQQLLIQKIFEKIKKDKAYLSPSKIKELRGEFNKMVTTNLSLNEMLGFLRYKDKIKYFFSFVLNAECERDFFENLTPGCMMYFPPRADFGGAAVILPIWATANNPEFYKNIKDFVFNITNNVGFLKESARIKILNGIDKKLVRKEYGYLKPMARPTAFLLKNNWFNVVGIANSPQVITGTTAIVVWSWDFKATLDNLRLFLPISNVVYLTQDPYAFGWLSWDLLTDADIVLILGNDFLR